MGFQYATAPVAWWKRFSSRIRRAGGEESGASSLPLKRSHFLSCLPLSISPCPLWTASSISLFYTLSFLPPSRPHVSLASRKCASPRETPREKLWERERAGRGQREERVVADRANEVRLDRETVPPGRSASERALSVRPATPPPITPRQNARITLGAVPPGSTGDAHITRWRREEIKSHNRPLSLINVFPMEWEANRGPPQKNIGWCTLLSNCCFISQVPWFVTLSRNTGNTSHQ